jgi:hypothetical protein
MTPATGLSAPPAQSGETRTQGGRNASLRSRQPPSGRADLSNPKHTKLAISKAEAAAMVDLSLDAFEDYVLPDLRVVRVGKDPVPGRRDTRRVIVPVRELEAWLDKHAAIYGAIQ